MIINEKHCDLSSFFPFALLFHLRFGQGHKKQFLHAVSHGKKNLANFHTTAHP